MAAPVWHVLSDGCKLSQVVLMPSALMAVMAAPVLQVLNNRFQVLQEMLDMLRDHQNNFHAARLEWVVIW